MAGGEIVRALHLDETRGRALELERAVAFQIELRWVGIGGGEELDLVLVRRFRTSVSPPGEAMKMQNPVSCVVKRAFPLLSRDYCRSLRLGSSRRPEPFAP